MEKLFIFFTFCRILHLVYKSSALHCIRDQRAVTGSNYTATGTIHMFKLNAWHNFNENAVA